MSSQVKEPWYIKQNYQSVTIKLIFFKINFFVCGELSLSDRGFLIGMPLNCFTSSTII